MAHFQSHQKADSFDRVVAAVDIVAHEQVVGVRRFAADSEELDQVVELTVNVSADGDRAFYLLDVGFVQ